MMFDRPVRRSLRGGVIYTDGVEWAGEPEPGRVLVLAIHGLGGSHRDFALLHAALRRRAPWIVPLYVDLPGFGNAVGTSLSLGKIRRFLTDSYRAIFDSFGQRLVILHVSASVWFTIGHALHPAVDAERVIAFNPVRIFRPRRKALRELLGEEVVDVRHEFLTRFFPPEKIRTMDASELGRPIVPLAFLSELWSLQTMDPLDGWRRALLIETRLDPMRELRASFPTAPIERSLIDAGTHGISDSLVAERTAEIVASALAPDR